MFDLLGGSREDFDLQKLPGIQICSNPVFSVRVGDVGEHALYF